MMSSEKAKRKALAIQKYQSEQNIRRGGSANIAFSMCCSAASLQLSYKFLGIRSVPYLAMMTLGGYLVGQKGGTYVVGKDSHRETFTLEEYHLLKEQLFGWQLKELTVLQGDLNDK